MEQPQLQDLLRGVIASGKPFKNFEVVFDFPSIGPRTMLLNARQLTAPGASQLIQLVIEDVTVRREARAALTRSETRYRRLFEAAKDGILVLDPLTRKITNANPFISELLGYSRTELIGKELWEIGLLKDEAASKAAVLELEAHKFVRYEDLPLESKSGQRREVEFVSNLYDEGGRAVIQCNIRDITERKEAEAALRESEARLEAILELLPVGVGLIGPDGRAMILNSIMTQFMPKGLPSGIDPWREACWRPVTPDGRALKPDQWPGRRALRGEHVVPGIEFVFTGEDGRDMWTNVAASPLRDPAGNVAGAVVMIQDIDLRKESEQELLVAIEDLKRAQISAVRASKAKDDFLAVLSHELRTPLTPVLLSANILREDERLPPEVRAQLSMMERNIALEARLIDDLLDLTLITQQKLRLLAEPCDAHQLIALAMEITREDTLAKSITLECHLAAAHSGLVVDPTRFQQIIWNLLRNAVKFTPAGGRIDLATHNFKSPREGSGSGSKSPTPASASTRPDSRRFFFLSTRWLGWRPPFRRRGPGPGDCAIRGRTAWRAHPRPQRRPRARRHVLRRIARRSDARNPNHPPPSRPRLM